MKVHKKGFAFIELFVIMMIIAILASILIPVVGKLIRTHGSTPISTNYEVVESTKATEPCICNNCTCGGNCKCAGKDNK